ncbi:hypothetical protein CC80DRAFT_535685 [Byssothecium circinans]|uniref:PNPLA domain-containing protein n=1 Tax=Byssothecium circinans TaxID=147558 RepID=A0A6A5TTT7_9PLEO|nr:hypothetical protein CC80DRAFT_535685 [Byssothecium circinans]
MPTQKVTAAAGGHADGAEGSHVIQICKSLVVCFLDVLFFWQLKLYNWYTAKSLRDVLLENLSNAKLFEEWEAAAIQLDEVLNYDMWRRNPASKHYDWRLIDKRFLAIQKARDEDDLLGLVSLLRSGLVRNLGNITAPRLFNKAYAGTKVLIENYITEVAMAIDYVTNYPVSKDMILTNQDKLDVMHDTRLAFGRSVLVLQGGAIFGLCHLGVVKALHLRGVLPRIIAGTATGALIAALVGVHTEDELLDVLKGSSINLTAFTQRSSENSSGEAGNEDPQPSSWSQTLIRRVKRFIREGYFLDVKVLEEVVRANVEDLTFQEAYLKTKRVLNITVSTTGRGGVPNVLNYLTAPNVLIWSAALASNASASTLYHPVTLLCKDDQNNIIPWSPASETTFEPWTHASYTDTRKSPLHRIAELFNVNHFIVSQARPYLAPFLRSDLHHPHPSRSSPSSFFSFSLPILRLIGMEIQHRLHQLNDLSLLPPSIRRFLLDESVPGMSLTLVPELTPSDFFKLLETPTREGLDSWILRGERSVWPAISALKVRCAIEVELDRGYQLVRRRRPDEVMSEADAAGLGITGTMRKQASTGRLRKSGSRGEMGTGAVRASGSGGGGESARKRRKRAASFGGQLGT